MRTSGNGRFRAPSARQLATHCGRSRGVKHSGRDHGAIYLAEFASQPKDGPDGLMLFDGVCNLCSGAVSAVLAMDRGRAIQFSPVQSPYGQMLAEAHGLQLQNPESFVFFDQGRPLTRSDAVAAMARRFPLPWRALVLIRCIPRGVRDGAYDWIAKRRYRLFGKRDTCMVPSADVRARFVFNPPGCE